MAEITQLSKADEAAFQRWVVVNGITDLDHPDSHYDYRGYWKQTGGAPRQPGLMSSHNDIVGPTGHFPDTYKQHGHPTFSQESQYSSGAADGGMWVGDNFQSQPKMAVSHLIEQLLLQRAAGGR